MILLHNISCWHLQTPPNILHSVANYYLELNL